MTQEMAGVVSPPVEWNGVQLEDIYKAYLGHA